MEFLKTRRKLTVGETHDMSFGFSNRPSLQEVEIDSPLTSDKKINPSIPYKIRTLLPNNLKLRFLPDLSKQNNSPEKQQPKT